MFTINHAMKPLQDSLKNNFAVYNLLVISSNYSAVIKVEYQQLTNATLW